MNYNMLFFAACAAFLLIFAPCFARIGKKGVGRETAPVFLAAALFASAARVFMLFFAVDPETGFTTDSFASGLFYVLLLLVILCALFCCYGKKSLPISGEKPVAVKYAACALAAAGFVFIAWSSCRTLVSEKPANMFTLLAMFSALPAACSMIFAMPAFKKRQSRNLSVLYLSGPVCVGFVLIKSFIDHITVASVSEYLFDVAMFIFVMLMFFADARRRGGFASNGELTAFSVCAILFICVSCLPKLYFQLAGGEGIFVENFSLLYLAFLMFLPYAGDCMYRTPAAGEPSAGEPPAEEPPAGEKSGGE